MVKFRFCPQCGGIDLQKLPQGNEYCPKCHFKGEAREGAMHELNAFQKQLQKPGATAVSTVSGTTQTRSTAEKTRQIHDDYEVW